jgi:arginyl-tRNA synthetase
VVKLQAGDPHCRELWQQFINESIRHCQEVYEKFNITLRREDIRAESAYNDDLPKVIAELQELGLLEENEGARCVFLPEFVGKDDRPLPAIIQKSDGGYPYMASDLAAVRYRSRELKVNRALYVVGGEQQLHLRQVFAVARAAGYIADEQVFRHLSFGMVLRPDGSRFKTREGADVKLVDVLDEAVERAYGLVSDKNPELPESERRNVARVVGIGAVKYAELSKNRTTDYIFDWDTMLSFEGNTAPYLQYAYTRIRSIFRRAGIDPDQVPQSGTELVLSDQHEQRLALTVLRFPEALDSVLEDYQANVLCGYLYDLATHFMAFYEHCPVLDVEEPARSSRLMLCNTAVRTLGQGLDLLGIETVERM